MKIEEGRTKQIGEKEREKQSREKERKMKLEKRLFCDIMLRGKKFWLLLHFCYVYGCRIRKHYKDKDKNKTEDEEMKKRVLTVLLSGVLAAASLCACSTSGENAIETAAAVKEKAEEVAENVTEEDVEKAKEAVEEVVEKAEELTTELPEYEYPGPEAFYTVLYDYVVKEMGKNSEGGVAIPDIMVTGIDESDKEDIKVYGDFACYRYTLNGDTLERTSGGSYPGCIHIKNGADGYTVTGMDMVEDGSNFDESVDRIFGDYAADFRKAYADDAGKENVWTQILANYVAANGLDIKYVQDYGWDPIKLPAENIDSFYSILDGVDEGGTDVQAVLGSITYMGGLYISDPDNDLMFSLFRNDDGSVVAIVTKLGNLYYNVVQDMPSAKLDDGREYTQFTVEDRTFGYNFGDDSNDPFVVDENGKVYAAKALDESAARNMVVKSLTGR